MAPHAYLTELSRALRKSMACKDVIFEKFCAFLADLTSNVDNVEAKMGDPRIQLKEKGYESPT